MSKGIVWLRNDLRVTDYPALDRALKECNEVLFVYVFDHRVWRTQGENPRMGRFRARFLLQALEELKSKIEDLGGQIEFLFGRASEEIPKLAAEYGASNCFAQREDAWEEINEERKLGEKCELILTEGKGLFENEDLPFELKDLPGVFSSFRRKVEKNLKIRPLIPVPEKISSSWTPKNQLPTLRYFGLEEFEIDIRAVLDFRGGEDAGISWMKEWIWERDCLKIYKETRNGMVGSDYSSKLSSWLASGCLSAVQVYWEIKKYEEERVANESTYWLFFELLWREFFRLLAERTETFWRSGIKEAGDIRAKGDPKLCSVGKTANAFVNANMIELARTGWMSNRGRQNVI